MSTQRRRISRKGASKTRGRSQRLARARQRGLFAERLEDRRLLTGASFPFHNPIVPTDVSGDYYTTPRDALMVINQLNEYGSRPLDPSARQEGSPWAFVDTDANNMLTPRDALLIINFLNNGEGQGEVVGFRLALLDKNGNPKAQNSMKVGEEARIQVYLQDLRGAAARGVFAAYVDMNYNNPALFDLNSTPSPTGPDDFQNLTTPASFRSAFRANLPYGPNLNSGWPGSFTDDPDGIDGDGLVFPNQLDEVGAIGPTFETGGDEFPFFYVKIIAANPGQLTFQAEQADVLGASDILVYGDANTPPGD
ncbi:MAG: hypothetical protein FJ276_24730, partial [Planctomycetes bacterium]|nr:hypothetical protein [Planctomycetota bacterium]